MIRSLRRKFILIAMASLVGTMVVLCTAIGIGNYCINTNRVDHAIALLRQNGGRFLPPVSCPLYKLTLPTTYWRLAPGAAG